MHTYVIGKSGSGKTTFLEHLIAEDLQQHNPLAVISPGEGNWFVERVLPMIPEEDLDRLVYFAPGSPGNTLCFNPLDIEADDDAETAGDHIFGALRRAMRSEELGPRSTPILQNAISAVMSRPEATLWDIKRILEEPDFRAQLIAGVSDEYTRDYWENTFTKYPKDATLPIINKLDGLLRPKAMRTALCQPRSSFSIATIFNDGKIFFFNTFGLPEEQAMVIGQQFLERFSKNF